MSYAEQQRGMFSSASSEWETPNKIFLPLHQEFLFTLDAAASLANRKVPRFFSEEENGLLRDWAPHPTWVNPPYGRGDVVGKWVAKGYAESQRGATVVLLVPARTETKWFHEIALPHAEIRFIKGRIRFIGARWNAPFPSCLVIFRPHAS